MKASTRTATVLALVCSVPASAASKAIHKPDEADQARVTMRIYSRCLVRTGRGGIGHARLVRFLSRSGTASDASADARAVAQPDCLQEAATAGTYISQLRFQPMLLRGEVFRALYLERSAQPGRPGAIRPAEIASGWVAPNDERATALRNFGDCVVSIDRVGADSAIRADVASEAETNAYRALGAALSRCLTANQTLHFSRAVLEGVFSESLYRQAAGLLPVATATETK